MASSNTNIRELDWYLRDHLFRQSNTGKTTFRLESLPNEMVTLYLRYRGTDPANLVEILSEVVENLVSRKVFDRKGNELTLAGRLDRFQCSGCFYINYLTEVEPRLCMKCGGTTLNDFPKRKA